MPFLLEPWLMQCMAVVCISSKKKYGESSYLNIEKFVDKDIIESCRTKRTFFPKNNACTNVERHLWVDVQTPYDHKEISEELRRRILKAFTTSWDDRFGFYLDDGWIYIYRSYCLLYRFRLDKHKDYRWVMRSFQRSGEKPDISLTPIVHIPGHDHPLFQCSHA